MPQFIPTDEISPFCNLPASRLQESGVQDSNISAATLANMDGDTKYGTHFLENTIPGCKLWKADHSLVGLASTTEHLDMWNIFLLFILPNSLIE